MSIDEIVLLGNRMLDALDETITSGENKDNDRMWEWWDVYKERLANFNQALDIEKQERTKNHDY